MYQALDSYLVLFGLKEACYFFPGVLGTTLNERLHRHLKRSMLCGASSVSPELAIPILALVLYVWTCRRRGLQKHANNQRVIPIIPFEFGDLKKINDSGNGYPLPFKWTHWQLAGMTSIKYPSTILPFETKPLQAILKFVKA